MIRTNVEGRSRLAVFLCIRCHGVPADSGTQAQVRLLISRQMSTVSFVEQSTPNALRVLSVMEARTITGPAKNLIRFASSSVSLAEPGLRPARLSVATFHRGPETGPGNPFVQAVADAGLEIDVIPERFRFDPRVFRGLNRVVRRRSPDIVQTHGIKAHFLVWATRLYRGRRWIAFHHGYTSENSKMRIYNQLNRFTLPSADLVVTVCHPFAENLLRAGVAADRIQVLPNAVEAFQPPLPERISELRQRLGIAVGERIMLVVGRFSHEKGHADLVPAMARLAQIYPHPIRCVMVGEGVERSNLERLIRAAGLGHSFIFAGHAVDVAPYYALADMLVVPSLSEGSPNVVLEAMVAGLPIAATRVGGIPETVDHDISALLFPARDPEAMAMTVARLLSQPELARRLARAGRQCARRFSPSAYERELSGIYSRLCPAAPVSVKAS